MKGLVRALFDDQNNTYAYTVSVYPAVLDGEVRCGNYVKGYRCYCKHSGEIIM